MDSVYQQIKDEFLIKYKKDIIPILEALEPQRQKLSKLLNSNSKKRNKFIIVFCVFALITVILVCLFPSIVESYIATSIFCVVLLLLLFLSSPVSSSLTKAKRAKIKFKRRIENELVPLVCSCFKDLRLNTENNTKEYYQKQLEHVEYLETQVKLFPKFASCSFNTLFSGVWNDTSFDISQASFIFRESDKRLIQVIIEVTFDKKFISHTVVTMDTKSHEPPAKHLKHTELEDVVFEKKFDVFTNDPIEARYLITTAFMERINNVSKVFQGEVYSCAFLNNQFYIALVVQSEFLEIMSINHSLEKGVEIFNVFNQILSIYKLIDYLTNATMKARNM